MTSRLVHRAGDTFTESCQAFVDLDMTVPRDLTGVTVTASMIAPMQEQYDFEVTIIDAANGQFYLNADERDTAKWRPTTWYAWITYTEGGDVASTETFQIEVVTNYNAAL